MIALAFTAGLIIGALMVLDAGAALWLAHILRRQEMPKLICPHCGREGYYEIVRRDPDGKLVYRCKGCGEEFK